MATKNPYPKTNIRRESAEADTGETIAETGAYCAWQLALAERACCCSARPKVVAVLPPTSARPYPMDLLLCGHHHRLAQAALAAKGAVVYDETGAIVPADSGRRLEQRPGPQCR
ncbi:MAG TPA: hypothetical protein VH912_28670 [Streptosporangiaceae bacterium]|jgi:hypothetical protein